MSEDIEIKSLERGYGKFLKIKIATWKDAKYVDLREYYTGDDEEVLPTKKGVRFSVDMLEEVQEALAEVKEHLANEE